MATFFQTQRLHKRIHVQTRVDLLVHLHDNIIDQYRHLTSQKVGVTVGVGQTKVPSAV